MSRRSPRARPKAAGAPAAPLKLTEDDRDVLIGLAAQREPLVRALTALQERQGAYLARLAARLGIDAKDIGTRYTINVDTLTLEPIPPS